MSPSPPLVLVTVVLLWNVSPASAQLKEVKCYIKLTGKVSSHPPHCGSSSAVVNLSKTGFVSPSSSLPNTALCSDLRYLAEAAIKTHFPVSCSRYVTFSPTTGGCNCVL